MLENTATFEVTEKVVYTHYTVKYSIPAEYTMSDESEEHTVHINFRDLIIDEVEYDTSTLNYHGEWYLKGLIAKTIKDIYNELKGGENKCD